MPATPVGGMINVCPYLASLPAICYVAYGRVVSLKYTLAHRKRYFWPGIHPRDPLALQRPALNIAVEIIVSSDNETTD